MVEVVVLGSGTPIPDPERAGSALAVVADGAWLLVDCGRAAAQRAIDAGLDLTAVVAVAITHHHSDHVSDLATFATTRWTAGATTPLTVVAPQGPAASFARRCLDAFDDQAFHSQAPAAAGPRPAIEVRSFPGSRDVSRVHASGGWTLSSVLVDHHPIEPSVAYLVEHDGYRVAISGDTAVCDGIRQLARDADLLVHEALLSGRVPPALLEWNAAARAVGELAAEAHPRTLVVTHLIPAPTAPAHEAAYRDEVRAGGFRGPTIVARDLLRIPVSPLSPANPVSRDSAVGRDETDRTGPPASPNRFYGDLAPWWPLISPPEEYAEEAAFAAKVLNSAERSVHEVLELGSGGGHNASHLKASFDMTLVDLSAEMLEMSRRLNPECEHHHGDMRTVRLGRTFDAVFVHDAVDYMTTESDLRQAIETALVHCRPGGIAVFVPDATTETFEPETDDGGSDDAEGRGVRYLAWSWDPDPTDTWTLTEYAFLLREADGSVQVVHETHRSGLFGRDVWLRLLADAGFGPDTVTEKTTEERTPRELFVGRRPLA